MISREQVADLRPGDVVEYRRDDWPEGCYVHSPLKVGYGIDSGLYVLDGHFGVRNPDGSPFEDMATLTVVSRAPRPLYVNHPRTEPVPGDVVRNADANPGDETRTWFLDYAGHWRMTRADKTELSGRNLPARLRLLVDGESGMPVGPDLGDAWDQGFEAGHGWWATGMSGQPVDPPTNPYETGQVVP